MKYTPETIMFLEPNEVFVFGSNMNGNHAGGAAFVAQERFGAKWGCPEGLRGQSYAIPTLNRNMEKVTRSQLTCSLASFITFCENHPEKVFYLTKIGCGIARWTIY